MIDNSEKLNQVYLEKLSQYFYYAKDLLARGFNHDTDSRYKMANWFSDFITTHGNQMLTMPLSEKVKQELDYTLDFEKEQQRNSFTTTDTAHEFQNPRVRGDFFSLFSKAVRLIMYYVVYCSVFTKDNPASQPLRIGYIINFFDVEIPDFDASENLNIKSILYTYPNEILTSSMDDAKYKISIIQNDIEKLLFEKKVLETDFRFREKEIKDLFYLTSSMKESLNFVGLVKAFNLMTSKKNSDLRRVNSFITWLGLSIFAPAIAEMILLVAYQKNWIVQEVFYSSIPISISVAIILLYFFRINLLEANKLKAQILQLELRSTLGQFIQEYIIFSGKIDGKWAESLRKFESIIFSNLVPNEDKIPSTIDGAEQMVQLIKTLKN